MSEIASLGIYFSCYLLSTLCLVEGTRKDRDSRLLLWIAVLFPVILAGGRYKVGTDFWQYMNNFTRWHTETFGEFLSSFNDLPLYRLIAKLSFDIGGRVLTFGVFAALIVIPVVKALRKEDFGFSLGLAFYIFLLTAFTDSFNLMKQYVAISMMFFGLRYVFSNDLKKFIICIIIAVLFHESALVCSLFWFVWDHKNQTTVSGYKRLFIVILTILVVFYYREAISWISSLSSSLSRFADYSTDISANNRDLYVSIAKLVILCIFIPQLRRNNPRTDFFYLLFLISVIIGFTGFSHPQVKRVALFFSVPSECYLFGSIPFCVKQGQEKVMTLFIAIAYMGLFVLTYYILGQSHILPYIFDVSSSWN